MARMSFSERYKQRKEGGAVTASSSETTTKTKRKSFSERYKAQKLERTLSLDTLDSDLKSLSETVNRAYGGWQDADTMANTKNAITAMQSRLNGYKEYVNSTGTGDLTKFNQDIDELISGYQSALDNWDGLSARYSNYKDADSYTSETTKLKELYSMTKDDLSGYLNNDNPIAYTTFGGQDITWQSLYDEQLHKEMATSTEGKEGWSKYQADEAAAEEAAKKESEGKKWYEWLGETLGGVSDTTLPAATISQTINAKREDDSYMKPTDEWTEAEQNVFGAYYLSDPEKAYEYAAKLNNTKNKQKKNEQMQNVIDSATSDFWTGTGHTIGALFTAPMGLADYLNDLTDMAAGRPITEGRDLSPFEYSQAVTSGISEKLNKDYGTIDENVPVLGGKGLGDLYGLGTSVAQSAVSANTMGPWGTLVSYFGQGAASGVDDALLRGATDEQAALYGGILGAAEGVSEHIGTDKLLKIGASDTLKELLVNTFKQAGAEGLEEAFSSLAAQVADNFIMQDKSGFNNAVRTYMTNGLNEEEAIKKAWLDSVESIAYDALGGFVSGGVHALPQTLVQSGMQYATKKELNDAIKQEEQAKATGKTPEVAPVQQKTEVEMMAEEMEDSMADAFVSLYQDGTDAREYKDSFELAFSYGKHGFGTENVLKNRGVLTEEQAAKAYEAGIKSANVNRQKQIDEVTAKYFTSITAGRFDDSKVDYSKINSRQKGAIEFTRMLSKATGINIEYFQSEADESGRRTAENGRFDRSTNTIYLDVYAGVNEDIAQDSIVPTLSHETTHWMKDKAPEAYTKLSEIIMDTLAAEHQATPVDLIHDEIERLKKVTGRNVSEEYAQDELIARACEDMLSGNRSVQELVSKMDEATAKTFGERLKVAFDKIKQWLADLLGTYKSNSEEAKIVQKYADRVNQLQEAWDDAFDKAVKANQVLHAEQSNMQAAASERVQHSEREIIGSSGKSYGVGAYLDSNLLTGLTESERKEMLKEFVISELAGEHFIAYDANNEAVNIGIAEKNAYIKNKNGKRKDVLNELYRKNNNFTVKQEAIVLIDELIANATYDSSKAPAYPHDWLDDKGKSAWDYWKVYLQEKNKTVWEATLNIANTANGEKILYDITPIKMVEQAVESATSTTKDSIHQDNEKSQEHLKEAASLPDSRGPNGSSTAPIDSISHSGENATENIQYSERDSQGNELTREQAERFKESKVRDEEGRLLVLFHQTEADFTEFDTRHEGAGSFDHETPYGVFMKPSASDIGIKGSKQMPLYALIKTPLRVQNRTELVHRASQDDAYRSLYEEQKNIDKEYGDKFKTAQDEFRDYIVEWRKNNPDASRRAIYDDEGFQNIYDNEENVIEEWESKSNEVRVKAKERLTEYLKESGYDGLIIEEDAGSFGRSTKTIVAFESNQVKDVKNQGPTDHADIRYSERTTQSIYDAVGEAKRLRKENERLKKDVERLRQRNKLERTVTGGTVLNEKQLEQAASMILRDADSTYDKGMLVEELKDVYKYLQSDDVTWDVLMLKATEVAQHVMGDKRAKNIPNDYAKEILYTLRNTKVKLNDTQKTKAKNTYGKDWYKAYFGRVLVTNDGIPIESAWQEWAEIYPDVFDADISDADMAIEVLNAYDTVKASSEIAEVFDKTEMEREIAIEIYNQFWNITPVRTLADKYEREIANLKHEKSKEIYEKRLAAARKYDDAMKKLRQEHKAEMQSLKEEYTQKKNDAVKQTKEYYKKIIKELREKRVEEVRDIKHRSAERLAAYKENEQRRNLVKRITTNSMRLNQWLTENSAKKHVPEPVKKTVAAFLNSIDFSSKQLLRGGDPTKADMELAEALEKVHEMADAVENAHKDEAADIEDYYGVYLDLPKGFTQQLTSIYIEVNKIIRTGGSDVHVLNNMSLENLDSLDKTVKILKSAISQMNDFISGSRNGSISTYAQNSIREMDALGAREKSSKTAIKIRKFLHWDNALPYYAFKRFGEGGMAVLRSFQNGWRTLAFHTKSIVDFTEATYTAKEARTWLKEVHEFDFEVKGKKKTVKITTAQAMTIYCLAKRKQAERHFEGGGIEIGDIEIGRNNVIIQKDGINLNMRQVRRLTNVLTDRQREVADRLQEFMNTVCASWGNEVSMRRFGYLAFTEENYFPIRTSENERDTKDSDVQNNSLYRLLNMSFTKNLTPNANNTMVIDDIFTVFAQHASDMAKYNALALPVLDAFKWYNYKELIENNATDGHESDTVKKSMEKAYGEAAKKYFLQFMRDINGSQSAGVGDEWAKTWMGRYKAAAVAGNLRVVALQPLSYVRALNVMDAKYLTKAVFKKSAAEKAMKYSGIAVWKSMGFYDTNISRSVQSMIKHDETWKDKAIDKSLALAGMADQYTWGKLWNACEAEIKDIRPELRYGSEAFNQIVAERFEEVIYATQVVDSTLTRTQLMRSKSATAQMITSFMSEPMVSYNMLMDCYMDWQADARKSDASTAWKKNGKKIQRAVVTFTVSAALTAAVEGIIDAWRDEDEDKEFDEKLLENIAESFANNINPLATIPFVRDIITIFQGYNVSRMDTEAISSVWYAYKGIERDIEKGSLSWKTTYNSLRALSQTTGMPFSNVAREIVAIWNNTVGEIYPSLKIK